MDRLRIINDTRAEIAMKGLLGDRIRRSQVAPAGNCPVSQCASYARQCLAESCVKCVPCRVGLSRVSHILETIDEGNGTEQLLNELTSLLDTIADSADCAIGFGAASDIRHAVNEAWDDLEAHVRNGVCKAEISSIPCMAGCPARWYANSIYPQSPFRPMQNYSTYVVKFSQL